MTERQKKREETTPTQMKTYKDTGRIKISYFSVYLTTGEEQRRPAAEEEKICMRRQVEIAALPICPSSLDVLQSSLIDRCSQAILVPQFIGAPVST